MTSGAVGVVGDQPVLVGLDRRDDVAHVHVAVALELLEQEVVDRGAVDDRAVERLVGDVESRRPSVRKRRRSVTPCGSCGVAV